MTYKRLLRISDLPIWGGDCTILNCTTKAVDMWTSMSCEVSIKKLLYAWDQNIKGRLVKGTKKMN